MAAAGQGLGLQRITALAVVVAAGFAGLPVVAAALDGPSTDQVVVPVHLVMVTALGAVVGYLLPGIAGAGSPRARGAAVGVLVGLGAGLLGLLLFYVLLG
jgi:asparagine N-glycosylation enzyme membrane subunit Stt3